MEVKKTRAKTENSIQNITWDMLIEKKAQLPTDESAKWDKRAAELAKEYGEKDIRVFTTLRSEMNAKYKWVEVASKKSSNGFNRFVSTHKK